MAPFVDLFQTPENILLGLLVMFFCIFFVMGLALVALERDEPPKKK